jgi:serine/threonine protein kinase
LANLTEVIDLAMENTITLQAVQSTPSALMTAFSGLAGGVTSLREIHSMLSQAIEEDPSCVSTIEQMLQNLVSAKSLSTTDCQQLLANLVGSLSDVDSTDSFEEAPAQSGIYRVDHEGTLILTEEEITHRGGFEKPVEVFDRVGAQSRQTAGSSQTQSSGQGHQQTGKNKSPPGPGSVLCDRYQLKSEVARGSMGIVYKAVDLLKQEAGARDPHVAIKLIGTEFTGHANALRSFQNEIANTQHLAHQNIINLFELNRDQDHYFITMEWLEGESLDVLLDRSEGSALPPTQTYAIIEQLCDAMIYAHGCDVIHADIKPANVFLVKSGGVKLIDWGIACIENPDSGDKNSSGFALALTPAYASCERLEKSAPNAQDDLYSLGCMVYRLLSGRRVFGAMHALEAENAGLEPVRIGGVSESRWNAMRKAMAFRREDRQATIKEFAVEFGQRATARDVMAEELAEEEMHSATTIIKKLPEDFLDPASVTINEIVAGLSETPSSEAETASGEQFEDFQIEDFPEQFNDTANLPGLDEGGSDTSELIATPTGTQQLSALEEVMTENTGDASPAGAEDPFQLLDIDLPEQVPGQAATNVASSAPAAGAEEVPFVDTMNLDVPPQSAAVGAGDFEIAATADLKIMPEPINLFDGDGVGLDALGQSTVSQQSAPVVEPPSAPKARPQPKAPPKQQAKPQQKAPPKQQAKPQQKAQPEAADTMSSTINQLRGSGQEQELVKGAVPGLPTRLVARPLVAVAGLLGAMVSIAMVLMMSPGLLPGFGEQGTAAVEPTLSNQLVVNEPAPAGMPVQVDLSVPGQVVSTGQTQFSEDGVALVELQFSEVDFIDGEFQEFDAELEIIVDVNAALLEEPAPIAATEQAQPVVDDSFVAPVAVPVVASVSTLSALNAEAIGVAVEPSPEASAPVVDVNPERSEYFVGLSNKTKLALSEGRLVGSDENNASFWIRRMREEGGDVSLIIAFEAKLVTAIMGRAEDAYSNGDLAESSRQLELAARHGATDDELAPLRLSIARLR